MPITVGESAPDFTLPGSDGTSHSLSDFRGQWVVIYFYPKDDTPGCTKEACRFAELHEELKNKHAVVLGISADDRTSHETFITKFNLPFLLLSDEDKSMMTDWGAYGEKVNYGRTYMGIIRSTVVVDPDGVVVKHWKRVGRAATHPDAVLKLLNEQR